MNAQLHLGNAETIREGYTDGELTGNNCLVHLGKIGIGFRTGNPSSEKGWPSVKNFQEKTNKRNFHFFIHYINVYIWVQLQILTSTRSQPILHQRVLIGVSF